MSDHLVKHLIVLRKFLLLFIFYSYYLHIKVLLSEAIQARQTSTLDNSPLQKLLLLCQTFQWSHRNGGLILGEALLSRTIMEHLLGLPLHQISRLPISTLLSITWPQISPKRHPLFHHFFPHLQVSQR